MFDLQFKYFLPKYNLIDENEINSVELQTFADVNVGSHLSGGIDSSLISNS